MRNYKHLCSNIENVENYEKAKADEFKGWVLHHRLETWTSDGDRRPINISPEELQALDMYWHRPSEELIFVTKAEHNVLHHTGNNYMLGHRHSETTKKKQSEAHIGKAFSEEHRKKLSDSHKGEKHYKYGQHLSKETRDKISEKQKGKQVSEETRKKISETKKGKCLSKEHRNKISEIQKGKHWYNNGKINKFCYECPEGFVPGLLR